VSTASKLLTSFALSLFLLAVVLFVAPVHHSDPILIEGASPNPVTLSCGSVGSPDRHPAHVESGASQGELDLVNGARELSCHNRRGLQTAMVGGVTALAAIVAAVVVLMRQKTASRR
jgi:hypothetical protein